LTPFALGGIADPEVDSPPLYRENAEMEWISPAFHSLLHV